MRFLFFHEVYILVLIAYKMIHIDPKSKTLDPNHKFAIYCKVNPQAN